jgi:hypothetical protein
LKLKGLTRYVAIRDIVAHYFKGHESGIHLGCRIHLAGIPLARWLRLLRRVEGTCVADTEDEAVNGLIANYLQKLGVIEPSFVDLYDRLTAAEAAADHFGVAFPGLTLSLRDDGFDICRNDESSTPLFNYNASPV